MELLAEITDILQSVNANANANVSMPPIEQIYNHVCLVVVFLCSTRGIGENISFHSLIQKCLA